MAINCAPIISSIDGTGCGFNAGGGFENLYLINSSQLTGDPTVSSNGEITEIKSKISGTLKRYVPLDNTSQFLQDAEGDSSKSIIQTINMQLSYAALNQDVKNELEKLLLGRFYAFVEKNNKYQFVAYQGNGLRGTTLPIDTGTAESDLSIISISLVARNPGYADFVTNAAMSALLLGPAGTSGN